MRRLAEEGLEVVADDRMEDAPLRGAGLVGSAVFPVAAGQGRGDRV
jgi:hypothetical protein